MVDVNEMLKKWSEKLGMKVGKLQEDYNSFIEEEKQIHPQFSEDEIKTTALQKLRLILGKQLASPAVAFTGLVVASTDLIDGVARRKKLAREAYKIDPVKAIRDGLTDESGIPLDNIKIFSTERANPRFGKPLPEHSWMRTIYGLATLNEGEKPKKFTLRLNGETAKIIIPLFMPVTFRAINKSKEGEEVYTLSGSAFTEFKNTEIPGFPEPEKIIEDYYSGDIITLGNIEEYHAQTKGQFDRMAVIRADVANVSLEPTSIGNRLIILEDLEDTERMENLESRGVLCWVPEHIEIDFGQSSKVYVFGRTGEMSRRNEDGSYSDTEKDVCMNATGIYAIPKYKVGGQTVEKTELKEEDLNTSSESTEEW